MTANGGEALEAQVYGANSPTRFARLRQTWVNVIDRPPPLRRPGRHSSPQIPPPPPIHCQFTSHLLSQTPDGIAGHMHEPSIHARLFILASHRPLCPTIASRSLLWTWATCMRSFKRLGILASTKNYHSTWTTGKIVCCCVGIGRRMLAGLWQAFSYPWTMHNAVFDCTYIYPVHTMFLAVYP